MARRLRIDRGGIAYHVINRRVGRMALFEDEGDYAAFEKVLAEACERLPMRVLGYCLMPNHWHLLLWPRRDGELRRFMQWLTVTHMRRWHAHHHSAGTGPLYQGRYKSFPIQADEHLLSVARYVEANARRAKLVRRAEQWRWGSLHRRRAGDAPWLAGAGDWPVKLPGDWAERVNEPLGEKDLTALRTSVNRGAPFGQEKWKARAAAKLGLASSLRDPWRPRKKAAKASGKET